MVEAEVDVKEEGTARKRKVIETSPPDDASSKRVKLEEENSAPTNGSDAPDDGPLHREVEKDTAKQEDSVVNDLNEEKPNKARDTVSPSPAKVDSGRDDSERPVTETRRPSIPQVPARRSVTQEEKKRGQRLFGGLLSTLSQTTASTQQKKRVEIERRQQVKEQKQRAEDDKRRAEKLAQLNSTRKVEQVKFDEQVMQTRHGNMLAAAHNLTTKSEPKLYYRPWQLTEAQEQSIKDQIQTVKELIDDETQDFKHKKEQRLKELGALHTPSQSKSTVGEPDSPEDTNKRSVTTSSKAGHDRDHDENGDEMVQDEEDTVLY